MNFIILSASNYKPQKCPTHMVHVQISWRKVVLVYIDITDLCYYYLMAKILKEFCSSVPNFTLLHKFLNQTAYPKVIYMLKFFVYLYSCA
jgi:hypothetical protein